MIKMNLIDWTNNYLDYVNSIKKNLVDKEKNNNEIKCQFKDKGSVSYLCYENLDDSFFKIYEYYSSKNLVIVTLNKIENLNFLKKNWHVFIKKKDLKFIFVNIKENLHWAIFPATHHFVSDNLELGLKALFDSVPSLD
ncbi:MAG: hypothetical protein QW757_03135 [Candidatus Woesearchaeota archaeon]